MFTEMITAKGTADTEIPTLITYARENPYEVVFQFPEIDDEDQDWIFGRDLIIEALEAGVAGHGDVRIVVNETVEITLGSMSAEGGFTLHYDKDTIVRLIKQSLRMVPRGTESEKYDSVITDEEIHGWFPSPTA